MPSKNFKKGSGFARRRLSQFQNEIKGEQGKASMFQTVGQEVGSLVNAVGVATQDNRTANKNVKSGAEEAGVKLPKDDNFFSNWSNKLGFTGPKEGNFTGKGDRTYSSGDLETLGMLRNAKSGSVRATLAQMESGEKPLSSYFGKDAAKAEQEVVVPKFGKNESMGDLKTKMAGIGGTYKSNFGMELPNSGVMNNMDENPMGFDASIDPFSRSDKLSTTSIESNPQSSNELAPSMPVKINEPDPISEGNTSNNNQNPNSFMSQFAVNDNGFDDKFGYN